MEYTKKVYREGNQVFYEVLRNREKITKKEIEWFDLGHFEAVFMTNNGTENCINRLFKKAHKEADYAIKTLIKNEYGLADD